MPEQFYTNAPIDYDWGWTTTLIDNVGVDNHNRPIRLVEIEDEFHANCQIGRYGSGLYFALTPEQFQSQVKHNFLTLTPDQEQHYFRLTFTPGVPDKEARQAFLQYTSALKNNGEDGVSLRRDAGRWRLIVKGSKDQAEATFNRIVGEMEAILKEAMYGAVS